jgi:hypothetical protein
MSVTISARALLYGCFAAAACIGLFLLWLWRPARQIKRHTENLLQAIEHKDWAATGSFIATDYYDQWGDDRARVLERMREGFRYMRSLKISSFSVSVQVHQRRAQWSGRISIDGDQSEVTELLKEKVDSLPTPFELEWNRLSRKPWDWKLVGVRNSALEIPPEPADVQ